ncbi:MAG: hydroxyacylglutathione hydrolase, partial [Solirubrobacteraceae bacterium]|nr:hydroxyacylglutathione hydrolase [Solirubrobacteraceae bacterium]
MIVERSMNEQFLSNTYLVCDRAGGNGLIVDAGGPVAPLIEAADRLEVTPSHVLLTHHHHDHVSEVPAILERWPDVQVLIHPAERALVDTATGTMDAGETVRAAG